MADELILKKDGVVVLAAEKGLADMIKPLKKEIYLFDTYIAGTSYLKDTTVLQEAAVGDALVLQREENKFDEKAILVLNEKQQKLGYVPEKDNVVFSRLMDAGKLLTGKISSMQQKETFTQIWMKIYLVDF